MLVYNVLTRELLLLNKEEIDYLDKTDNIDNQITRDLINKWFLVPLENNDAKLRRQASGAFNFRCVFKYFSTYKSFHDFAYNRL